MNVFEEIKIGNVKLKNRIIRSSTFEGMWDKNGFPQELYYSLYEKLAKNELGGIITGCTYISAEGRMMQPGGAGMDSPEKVPFFRKLTDLVHQYGSKIFVQLIHSGRQTRQMDTGQQAVGCSTKKSFYFKEKPRRLTITEIKEIVEKFGDSALYAKDAGFDGVQLHGAHGYLIHQFMLPAINNRKDEYGIDKKTGLGIKFFKEIIQNVRQKCGPDYAVMVKISWGIDLRKRFTEKQFINLIKFLDTQDIDGLEISYGTMDHALNIFRGDVPVDLILKRNPLYKTNNKLKRRLLKAFILPFMKVKLKPFSPVYNLNYAELAKKFTKIPVISVGGFRSYEEMDYAIQNNKTDLVSLSRPLICEPDFISKIIADHSYTSKCINCNFCAVMCDTKNFTKCYKN